MSALLRDKKTGAGKDILVRAPRMECQPDAGKGPYLQGYPKKAGETGYFWEIQVGGERGRLQ